MIELTKEQFNEIEQTLNLELIKCSDHKIQNAYNAAVRGCIETLRYYRPLVPEYLVDFNDGIHERSIYITTDPQPNDTWIDIKVWIREGDNFRLLSDDEVRGLRHD